MRAVAASRKLGKMHRPDTSSYDKGGTNGGVSHSGARQKIASQRASSQRRSAYTSTALYTPVPTTSISDNFTSFESNDLLPSTSSMVTSQTRISMAPPGTSTQEVRKVTPAGDKKTAMSTSSRSLEKTDGKLDSPSAAVGNGPKKTLKDTVPRTVSNLSRAPSSVATTNIGAASKIESKIGARRKAIEKRYYAKAIGLMSGGGFILAVGFTLAGLHFAGYEHLLMAGPIALSIGLLLLVCGIVWIPVIKTKLKRKQQIMSRTFSL